MNINVFNLPGKRKHFGDNIPRASDNPLSVRLKGRNKKIPVPKIRDGDPVNNPFLYKPVGSYSIPKA